jgi:hypothetical protein
VFDVCFRQTCSGFKIRKILGQDHANARNEWRVGSSTNSGVGCGDGESGPFNVCLCSYQGALENIKSLQRLRWSTLLLDNPNNYVEHWNSEEEDDSDDDDLNVERHQINVTKIAPMSSLVNSMNSSRRVLTMSRDNTDDDASNANVVHVLMPTSTAMSKTDAKKFIHSVSTSMDSNQKENDSTTTLDTKVSCHLVGCRPSWEQTTWYEKTASLCVRQLLNNNDSEEGKDDEEERAEVALGVDHTTLARLVCSLHQASTHTRMSTSFQMHYGSYTDRKTKSSLHCCALPSLAVPSIFLNDISNNPVWSEAWTTTVNFQVLNLALADQELVSNPSEYQHPVRGASNEQMTTSALRYCRFHLDSVHSSVLERDDGGPLAGYARLVHAQLLSATEQACRHKLYINHFRCSRVGVYLGVRRILKALLHNVRGRAHGTHGTPAWQSPSGTLSNLHRDVQQATIGNWSIFQKSLIGYTPAVVTNPYVAWYQANPCALRDMCETVTTKWNDGRKTRIVASLMPPTALLASDSSSLESSSAKIRMLARLLQGPIVVDDEDDDEDDDDDGGGGGGGGSASDTAHPDSPMRDGAAAPGTPRPRAAQWF